MDQLRTRIGAITLVILAVVLVCLAVAKCGNGTSDATGTDTTALGLIQLSERDAAMYNHILKQIEEGEANIAQIENGSATNSAAIIENIRQIHYTYNAESMNAATRAHCAKLEARLTALKERALKASGDSSDSSDIGTNNNAASTFDGQAHLLTQKVSYPIYLLSGDVLRYNIQCESSAGITVYNADTHKKLKSHSSANVNDSVKIKFAAVYLVEIDPRARQYVSADISFTPSPGTSATRPKVRKKAVICSKKDFGAIAHEGIKIRKIFDEPRKFTLRGKIKASFSGASIAVIPVTVPKGVSEFLFSMRLSTSEQSRASDGKFADNMQQSYRSIKIFKLPVYESTRRSGIINMLLDDNRPITEEDAYCNMYVFRNASEAKKFQDGTSVASKLNYDVNYSRLGTQSCNGRIPTKGNRTIYLAFENERMRFTNYLWVEAAAAVPTTEYYRIEYSK